MAVLIHDVTVQMVLDKLYLDTRWINESSSPLNTPAIEGFIRQGSAKMTGVLTGLGISTPLSDDDTKQQVQTSVVAYAKWQCLDTLPSVPQSKIDAAERAYLAELEQISNRGEFLKTAASDKTESNIDTTTSKPPITFGGTDYKY